MRHYTEDELVLYHYGEGRRRGEVEQHLDGCAACAAVYRDIAATLALIATPETPERADQYGLEVWQRIRHRLPDRDAPSWAGWLAWHRLALGAGLATLLVAAFAAGRVWPDRAEHAPPPAALATSAGGAGREASERVRVAAVGDHLERSERVLLDLMNARGAAVDVSDQQAWAADLIDSNRLYRDAATRAGDEMVAGVLDELERSLLEIVHGPSTLSPAQLEAVRLRLDAAALLFKVRVLHDALRERAAAPSMSRKTS